MNYEFLKDYVKLRSACEFCIDVKNKGDWCKKDDMKCSYDNCLSFKKTPSPLFPVETKKERLGYHKNKLHDLRGLSKLQLNVLKWRSENPPLSFLSISKRIKKSKSRAYQIYAEAKGYLNEVHLNDKPIPYTNDKPPSKKLHDKKLKIRLHNDNVSIAIFPVEFLFEKTVKLKYTEYLNKNSEKYHVRIFKNGKLLIRFKDCIYGDSVEEVKIAADERVNDFVKNFQYKGIKFLKKQNKYIQLQRDYAIIGTDLAKKYIKERKKFFIFDEYDGKCRAEIDYSNNVPEYENPHPKKGYADAKISEAFFNDLLNKDFDLPSESKIKLDYLIDSVNKFAENSNMYAQNIQLHLQVLSEMKDTIKDIKKLVEIRK